MRGITLIFGICAAASLVPVHAQDDAKHGIEKTAVSNPHIDIARVKPSDLSGPIGIGGAWQTPPYVALSDDPFDERYGAWGTPTPTR